MHDRLPDLWVKKILERLQIRYGDRFARMYAGLNAEHIESDWAEVLASYTSLPEAIKGALANLPIDHPPNALQFRDLCRQYRPAPPPMLMPPRDPLAKEKIAEAVRSAMPANIDPLRWAHDPRSIAVAREIALCIQKKDRRMIEIGAELVRQGHKYAGPIKDALVKVRRHSVGGDLDAA